METLLNLTDEIIINEAFYTKKQAMPFTEAIEPERKQKAISGGQSSLGVLWRGPQSDCVYKV